MPFLSDLSHAIGFGLCHQLPERSFIFGGVQLPVCARCTGIYMGFTVALIVLLVLYRGAQRTGLKSWPFIALAVLCVVAIAVDGLSSYLGYRATTNFIRLCTGVAFGVVLGSVAYTTVVDSLSAKRSGDAIVRSVKEVAAWAGSLVVAVLLVYGLALFGPFASVISAVTIALTFSVVIGALVGLAGRWSRSVARPQDAIAPLLIGLAFAAVLILALAAFRWSTGG